jgi:hypothetical protein
VGFLKILFKRIVYRTHGLRFTNSKGHNPSSEADSHLDIQEIPCFFFWARRSNTAFTKAYEWGLLGASWIWFTLSYPICALISSDVRAAGIIFATFYAVLFSFLFLCVIFVKKGDKPGGATARLKLVYWSDIYHTMRRFSWDETEERAGFSEGGSFETLFH